MRSSGIGRTGLVAPSAAIFVLIFVAPFLYFLIISLWRVQAYRMRPATTLQNYAIVFADYTNPLLFSLAVALVVALVTTSLAFAFAYGIRFRAGRWGDALLFVALLTLFGGYLSKIYAWKTILGSAGILNSGLQLLGI